MAPFRRLRVADINVLSVSDFLLPNATDSRRLSLLSFPSSLFLSFPIAFSFVVPWCHFASPLLHFRFSLPLQPYGSLIKSRLSTIRAQSATTASFLPWLSPWPSSGLHFRSRFLSFFFLCITVHGFSSCCLASSIVTQRGDLSLFVAIGGWSYMTSMLRCAFLVELIFFLFLPSLFILVLHSNQLVSLCKVETKLQPESTDHRGRKRAFMRHIFFFFLFFILSVSTFAIDSLCSRCLLLTSSIFSFLLLFARIPLISSQSFPFRLSSLAPPSSFSVFKLFLI